MGQVEMSNIVVHIFSNEPKLFSAWAALASTLSSTVCWNEHSSFVADAFVPPSGPETEVEGKVFEICAGLVEISPERDVTLETCRQVQELDMVRKIEKKEGVEVRNDCLSWWTQTSDHVEISRLKQNS